MNQQFSIHDDRFETILIFVDLSNLASILLSTQLDQATVTCSISATSTSLNTMSLTGT